MTAPPPRVGSTIRDLDPALPRERIGEVVAIGGVTGVVLVRWRESGRMTAIEADALGGYAVDGAQPTQPTQPA